MLSLVSLKKAIVSKLKSVNVKVDDAVVGKAILEDENYNIVAKEIRSGFNKPAFFIQIMPISNNTYDFYEEKTITVDIHYFPKDKTYIDNLKMIDILNDLFKNILYVENRKLTIYEKRQDIDDNVLQYKFDLRFSDEVESDEIDQDENYEYMQELYINNEREG